MLWCKWFHKANIYAFDLDDNKINNCKNMNIQNIVYNNIDVSDESNINLAFSSTNVLFDIIVDNSSHIIQHQNNIINNSAKFLRSGGILIIEDIQRDTNIAAFNINKYDWHYYTFITCDHYNRYCSNNDKILYLVKN
jgi:2-polyprenyl-3-methyl-5-hydroxy-6-metoxy-1,4-benzoquinol methylase